MAGTSDPLKVMVMILPLPHVVGHSSEVQVFPARDICPGARSRFLVAGNEVFASADFLPPRGVDARVLKGWPLVNDMLSAAVIAVRANVQSFLLTFAAPLAR